MRAGDKFQKHQLFLPPHLLPVGDSLAHQVKKRLEASAGRNEAIISNTSLKFLLGMGFFFPPMTVSFAEGAKRREKPQSGSIMSLYPRNSRI